MCWSVLILFLALTEANAQQGIGKAIPLGNDPVGELLMLFMRPVGMGGNPKREAKDFYEKVWQNVNAASGGMAAERVDPQTGAVGNNRQGRGPMNIREQEVTGLSLLRAGKQQEDPQLTLLGAKAIHFGFQHMQNEDGSFMYSQPGGKSVKGTALFTAAASQAIQLLSTPRDREQYGKILEFWRKSTQTAALWLCGVANVPGVEKKLSHADEASAVVNALIQYDAISLANERALIHAGIERWIAILGGPSMQNTQGAFRAGQGADTILQSYVLVHLSEAYAHNRVASLDEPLLSILGKGANWQKQSVGKDGKPDLRNNTIKRNTKDLELMDLAMLILSLKMWAIVGGDQEADTKSRDMIMYTISNLNQFSSEWAGDFVKGAMGGIQQKVGGR